ncbi:glutamyl-tRNA reductase [Friedmanniella luteola]|uniref:Glutamyl-tRNA reductase n=1 Tax=Friedmanniella luteola TaxID=546871 RepID=A0A1H1LT75_9ACTN|nr:glutamyl-tRNA reductase [Friedmanniella luteola]SDR77542.1 glutamyl-tRNA reductase [Friedmanniella luteola]
MSILVVSVSHRSTSVGMLSRLAMGATATAQLAEQLVASDHVDEAVVLSTCNRTELYASVSRFHGGLDDAVAALAALAGLSVTELRTLCAVFFDEGAVAHTFSVAAGLDSVVVGESQILGQVRTALSVCQDAGTVGTVLNSLFQQALRVGKRVQTETGIGSAGRSLVTAAYDLLATERGSLEGRRVLVVGAGQMAGLAARTAAAAGAQVSCANRTLVKAERLAESVGGRAVPLDQLDAALADTDVLVTCTGARSMTIGAGQLAGTPVTGVVDLALPPDVSEDVHTLGISLVNLDRLVAGRDDDTGSSEVAEARALVRAEVRDFLGLRRAAQVAPTVVALRSMASEVVAGEMSRLSSRLPTLGERERDEVQRTVRRVVDKLLHQPTVRVQELSTDPDAVDYAAALRELFALDPQSVAAVMSAEVPSA